MQFSPHLWVSRRNRAGQALVDLLVPEHVCLSAYDGPAARIEVEVLDSGRTVLHLGRDPDGPTTALHTASFGSALDVAFALRALEDGHRDAVIVVNTADVLALTDDHKRGAAAFVEGDAPMRMVDRLVETFAGRPPFDAALIDLRGDRETSVEMVNRAFSALDAAVLRDDADLTLGWRGATRGTSTSSIFVLGFWSDPASQQPAED